MTVILHVLEQGSDEWHQARLGRPSASCFSKIITTTGKASSSAKPYMLELAADYIAGEPQNNFISQAMQNGIDTEPVARIEYEMITGNDVDQVGLGYLDEEELIVASPDGLIGEDGGLEIKCPKLATHLKYTLDGKCPTTYFQQVQGCMWVFGRQWWDFMSYHDDAKPFCVRVIRDDDYIEKMSAAVLKFSKELEAMKAKLIKLGVQR